MNKKIIILTVFISLFGHSAFGWFYRGDDGHLHWERHHRRSHRAQHPRYRNEEDPRSVTERAANKIAETADRVAGAARETRIREEDQRAYAQEESERRRREQERKNEENREEGYRERKEYERKNEY